LDGILFENVKKIRESIKKMDFNNFSFGKNVNKIIDGGFFFN
jgi:hypothetical protein